MRPWVFPGLLAAGLSFAVHAQQTLYNFESPAEPTSSLVDGGDGFFYGTAVHGGRAGKGIVYKVDLATGERTTVITFNGSNGSLPYGDVLVRGQFLYGTTSEGGASDAGIVYKFDRTTGTLTMLHQFTYDDGGYPKAGLVAFGTDLYGTTSDGGSNLGGTIFRINPDSGAFTSLFTFRDSSDKPGRKPAAPLLAVGSMLYGTTHDASNGPATAFKLDPATGTVTMLTTRIGAYSVSGLVAAGPALYGTTSAGSTGGALFKIDVATGTVSIVYSFDITTVPTGSLIYDGTYLYGTSERSTNGFGSVFRFDPANNTLATLASFDFTNGAAPRAALLLRNGTLYGATSGGGPNNGGSIFKVDSAIGALATLSFFNEDGTGAIPLASPTIDGHVLYGTALQGGAHGLGTVFRMDLSTGSLDTLASFDVRSGGNPWSSVIVRGGKLYGTAASNGADGNRFTNAGTVYSVDPANGALTMIAAFDSTVSGFEPLGALTAVGPYLYGTNVGGGGLGAAGTVFRVDPAAKTLTTLYKFQSPYAFGSSPRGTLLLRDGALYGTTHSGGTSSRGTVFGIDPSTGALTYVTSFVTQTSNASTAESGLTSLGSLLYGTTALGGQFGKGTVYKVDPQSGAISIVFSFNGTSGAYPGNGVLVTDGKLLYGTTQLGGAYDHGTVFQLDPATGKLTVLLSFDIDNGDAPYGGLVLDGSFLYGTTEFGGARGGGTLFRLPLPRPKLRSAGRR